jgi:DNA-binding CsgD family transcriptional regulator
VQALIALDFAADCVTAADFDGDGLPEFVAARETAPELLVYNVAAGEQVLRTRIPLDSFPVALAHGDFDSDGAPELAVGLIDARLAIFRGDGALKFSLTRTLSLSSRPRDLDVSLVGRRPFLLVATSSCVEAIDPIEAKPELPPFGQSIAQATEHLEGSTPTASVDALLADSYLTHRERDVLSLALRGVSAREIGRQLFIGERTVETHLAHAFTKLGVRSRIELLIRLSSRGAGGTPNSRQRP